MCGISAFVTQRGAEALPDRKPTERYQLEKTLDDSLELVKHRGPDARGQWISSDNRVGLGHVRLSIVDLSPSGNQPFHDEVNDIHSVVNGELYGHEEYRAKLANEFDFKGNSDCEIVIALYKHYGLGFLSHLRGEFALCLWDAKRELFIAARDRYGIKSLYYTVVDGKLLVATEMKSFLAFGWKPKWNTRAIVENAWRINDKTMFEGVRKILPGQYMIAEGSDPVRFVPYWDLDYPDKKIQETRTEEELIATTRQKLVEAVRLRLRADVPVGIYLSGGLDSSSVAGIVAHLIKERGENLGSDNSGKVSKMTCFTVAFDKDSGADESDVAQRTAEWLGVNFVPVHMDENMIASRFEDAVYYTECVAPDANGPGRLAMAEASHRHGVKVVLTGEGSDEHFAGYSGYYRDMFDEPDYAWPSSIISDDDFRVGREMAEKTMFIKWTKQFEERPDSTSRMLNHTKLSRWLTSFIPAHWSSWVENGPRVSQETVMAESFNGRVLEAIANKWHPLHTSQYLWTKTAFPNILLRYIGDNVDMVHHIESRTPFLDHKLTEFANTIPPSLKIKYEPGTQKIREKYILKEAMKPFITQELYERKKMPYIGPATWTTGGPMHMLMSKLVTKENVEQLGFIDWEQAKTCVEDGFVHKDVVAVKEAMSLAQFVTLAKRFGVSKAEKPRAVVNGFH